MSVRMVLASKNAHKLVELRRILEQVGLDIDLVGISEFPDLPDVDETGTSFAANALLKARAISAFTGLPAIGDDSGICVDALNGMPGIYSARWAGTHGDDEANLNLLIAQLDHVPAKRRGAAFHCAAAIVTPEGDERVVEGTLDGVLITERRTKIEFAQAMKHVAEMYPEADVIRVVLDNLNTHKVASLYEAFPPEPT